MVYQLADVIEAPIPFCLALGIRGDEPRQSEGAVFYSLIGVGG